MRILIACEFSGVVRDAFIKRGHSVVSCDLLRTEKPGPHYRGDIFELIENDPLYIPHVLSGNNPYYTGYDLMVAFPPCTHLSVSGARWFKNKVYEQQAAINFFKRLAYITIPKICIENPVGIMSTHYQKPDQYIQPWQFGHGETKKTCLWLKKLPKLKPTNIVAGREARIHKMPPSKDRGKLRSITYQGIADAMAAQWG